MTGWRILVQEAASSPAPIEAAGRPHYDIETATRLGLIEPVGRKTGVSHGPPILYRATEAGRLFAEGRLTVAELPNPGRRGRVGRKLVATWLRALPEVTPSQWGAP